MPRDEDRTDPVVALRFDEAAAAKDLAAWCSGEVVLAEDDRAGLALRVVIEVPTPRGVRRAWVGDWIVRRPDGTFEACAPQDFVAQYEPLAHGEPVEGKRRAAP